MRRIGVSRLGLLGFMLLVLLMTSRASATIFWDDDFEGAALNVDFGGTWLMANGCTPAEGCNPRRISDTSLSHSGAYSLWSHYDFSCGMTPGAPGCGTYMDRYHPRTREVYLRWWTRFINGQPNPETGSKQFYNKSDDLNPMLIFWHIFPNTTTIAAQFTHSGYLSNCPIPPSPDAACNLYANVPPSANLFDGQWHCVETRVYSGTPGNYDGTAEAWVDGRLQMRYKGLAIKGPGFDSLYDQVTHYAQMGGGDRFVDQVAVGDSRIGCGTQSNVTPNAPAGLWAR